MIITQNHIPLYQWSRPGKKRQGTLGLVIHWLSVPMQTAEACRHFFATRDDGKFGSAQYIVGLQGEVIQVMPEDEMAYHCGSSQPDPVSRKPYTDLARTLFDAYAKYQNLSPNQVTIGIECCHVNAAGEMTKQTYQSLVELSADICLRYHLDPFREIVTHKEVVGWKDCHKWFVDNPDCFQAFKKDVQTQLEKLINERKGLK